MKKMFLIIAILNITALADSCICESAKAEQRMAAAFERIATSLEKIAAESSAQNKQLTAVREREFQRSLKAVPTDPAAVKNSPSELDGCMDKCWNLPLNSQIKPCVEKCVKSYR